MIRGVLDRTLCRSSTVHQKKLVIACQAWQAWQGFAGTAAMLLMLDSLLSHAFGKLLISILLCIGSRAQTSMPLRLHTSREESP